MYLKLPVYTITLKYHTDCFHTETTLNSHWKYLQRKPHWESLKYFPLLFKDTNITLIFLKITLKNFQRHSFHFFSRIFSVTLDFQCDFQCHSFIVKCNSQFRSLYEEKKWNSHISRIHGEDLKNRPIFSKNHKKIYVFFVTCDIKNEVNGYWYLFDINGKKKHTPLI